MKKILSIDGGGIRGLIPALVLAEIEKKIGKATADCFDLIAGTPTGGILALGLSKDNGSGRPQYSANDLAKIYQLNGKEIFPSAMWNGILSIGGWVKERYPAKGIEGVLDRYFGNETIGTCLTNTLITSYEIFERGSYFIKSWREDDAGIKMKDAARATSAAPKFFEPALIKVGDKQKACIDGGIFINSPSVSAYVEAKKIFPDEKDFFVVSLGTGEFEEPTAAVINTPRLTLRLPTAQAAARPANPATPHPPPAARLRVG